MCGGSTRPDNADPAADPALVGGVAQLCQILGPDRHTHAVAARRAEINQHARFAAAVSVLPYTALDAAYLPDQLDPLTDAARDRGEIVGPQ